MMSSDNEKREYSKELELNIHVQWLPLLICLYTLSCLVLIVLARVGLVESLSDTPSYEVGELAILVVAAIMTPGLVLLFYAVLRRRFVWLVVLGIGLWVGGIVSHYFVIRYVFENPKFP